MDARPQTTSPPLPVLGEPIVDQNGQIERSWKNAPSIVRDVRALAILGVIVNVCLVLVGTLVILMSMLAEHPEGKRMVGVSLGVILAQFAEVGLFTGLIVLLIWLIPALRLGNRAAWTTQLVLAIVGLAGIPVGTLIGIYILTKWNQPETKRWFGISA